MFRPQLGLLSNLGLALLLLLPTSGLAKSLLGRYTSSPTAKKVYQRRNAVGGSRSDCQSPLAKNSLTLLVPEEKVVHQTATNHPSFLFYAQAASTIPLEFTLVDPDVTEPLVEEPLYVKQQGYHQVTLPESVKLEPNQTYLWHIAIPCANDPENFWSVLAAAVEYVPLSAKITQKLQHTDADLEKAQIYASNGIWYDAIDFANRARSELKSSTYWQQLLSDINISTTNQ